MSFNTPPYLSQNNSVRRIMGQVLLALLPGVGVYAWLIWTRGFGPADRALFKKHPEQTEAAPAA